MHALCPLPDGVSEEWNQLITPARVKEKTQAEVTECDRLRHDTIRSLQEWLESSGANAAVDRNEQSQLDHVMALMGSEELKISQISFNDDLSVENRMRLIIQIDRRFKGRDSPSWSDLLRCSAAAVTKAWRKSPDLRH